MFAHLIHFQHHPFVLTKVFPPSKKIKIKTSYNKSANKKKLKTFNIGNENISKRKNWIWKFHKVRN